AAVNRLTIARALAVNPVFILTTSIDLTRKHPSEKKGQGHDAHSVDFGAHRRRSTRQATAARKNWSSRSEGSGAMTLALLQVISQSISSTLHWVGLYIGIRALPGDESRQRAWVVISALVFAAWLVGIVLLASDNFFPPSRIPVALFATLALGYLIL